MGDSLDFHIDSTNVLMLQAFPQTSSSFLAFPSTANQNASYEFELFLGFNPSSSNYAKVFVWSDVPIPSIVNNGVYIAIGGTSEDKVSLYGISQGQSQLIVESNADLLNEASLQLKIKVELDSLGNYHLWTQKGADSMKYIGFGFFHSPTPSQSFIIECHYTSTRSDKFRFDAIRVSGAERNDLEAPSILRSQTNIYKEVMIILSLDTDTSELMDPDHFKLLPGNIKPDFIYLNPTKRELSLQFNEQLNDSILYVLTISNIPDYSGNLLDTSLSNLSFYEPITGDILFSEVLFDAIPPVQLPEEEGFEIYNRRAFPIKLNNWTLSNGKSHLKIDSFSIGAHSYAWIANDPENWTSIVPKEKIIEVGIGSDFLTSEEGSLLLSDSSGSIIDHFNYSKDLFDSEPKELGGWTLERSDLSRPCSSFEYWSESVHPFGGTPANENSKKEIISDSQVPFLRYYSKVNDSTLELIWNENVHLTEIPAIAEAFVNLDSSWISSNNSTVLSLKFRNIPPTSTPFTLMLHSGLKDCTGNNSEQNTISLSFPETQSKPNLQIEEVLFDPTESQVEFVEIVNRSQMTFDIQGLRFWVASDTFSSNINSSNPIVRSRIIQPGERICIAREQYWESTNSFYSFKKHFVELHDFPNLNASSSSFGLMSLSLENIDKASYNTEFHSVLLSETKGHSLQRISYSSEAHTSAHWRSTLPSPGMQTANIKEENSYMLSLENECWQRQLSNGFELNFSESSKSMLLDLSLFAVNGVPLCKITERKWVHQATTVLWEGKGNSGETILPGIYLLVATLYLEDGSKRREVHPFSICD